MFLMLQRSYGCTLLLFLTILCYSYPSGLSANEFTSSASQHDAGLLNKSGFCSVEKLLTRIYEKSRNMYDLNVHDFDPCSCKENLSLALSVTRHALDGDGSHRILSSIIHFEADPVSFSLTDPHFGRLIIIQRLPSGLFADPFELSHLVDRGDFASARIFGDTNVELPSFLSDPSIVEIHLNVDDDVTSNCHVSINIPLHARYPPLSSTGYVEVEIGAPVFLMVGNLETGSCFAIPAVNFLAPGGKNLAWEVPAGKPEHALTVSLGTFVSALVCTVLISFSAIFLKRTHSKHA